MVEGTVSSLLEDGTGNIVGVEYKDKTSGERKVNECVLHHLPMIIILTDQREWVIVV